MNTKTRRTVAERGARPRLRAAFSALFLVAASTAFAAAPAARDSTGNPVRGAQGACIDTGAGRQATPDEACAQQPKRTTYRILQNLIPQPTVSFAPAPPLPASETVRFLPRAAFVANQAGMTPELREELYGFLASLEGYQRIERFEVIGHGDGNPKPDYAQWLGGKRAESTRSFLIGRGIAATMVDARGAPRSEAAARGRVELVVTVRGRR